MAHNANTEDYQRLALRYVMATNKDPADALLGYSRFWNAFSHDRDALPQTDADRAFHLVALATAIVDYRLPFAMDEQVDGLLARATQLLDEALTLDPDCHDARRMRHFMGSTSFDGRLAFLVEHKDEVKGSCMDALAEARNDDNDERSELASHLAVYPYYRWLAALADHALVCGHNRACINYCRELLELDPTDLSDARFTMALCFAKMEDQEGFDTMGGLFGPGFGPVVLDDAWSLIARTALAFKAGRLDDARRHLGEIVTLYPMAEEALKRQVELPDGLFARVHVTPYSEDELILALSEATVLTQEGAEEYSRGPFGIWITDTIVQRQQIGPLTSLNARPGKRGGTR